MPKKDFAKLGLGLVEIANSQPSMRPPVASLSVVPDAAAAATEPAAAPASVAPSKAKPAPAAKAEAKVQQAFELRTSLRKQLHRLAAEDEMTVGAFILAALRAKGLDVTESDLIDRRKVRG